MPEILGWLCAGFLAFLILGYVIWLAVSVIVRTGVGQDSIAEELRDMEATNRQLTRFRRSGALPVQDANAIRTLIAQRREQLSRAATPDVAVVAEEEIPSVIPVVRPEPVNLQQPPIREAEVRAETQAIPALKPAIPDAPVMLPVASAANVAPKQDKQEIVPAESDVAGPPLLPFTELTEVREVQPSRWTGLLAAFMEERNILWGELVGGLLIVGGSIALVVSLWNTLQANPYFPFLIFAAITAGLSGAGLYTWGHWKLQATSRGLLVIAALLIPLTFLVLPGTRERGGGDLLELLIAAVALGILGWLLRRAAGVLTPSQIHVLPVAVIGCALAQLATARLVFHLQPSTPLLLLLAAGPMALQIAAIGWVQFQIRWKTGFTTGDCALLFTVAGVVSYAAFIAMGFLVARCQDSLAALNTLAPFFAALGVPILTTGLIVHRRLTRVREQAALRMTGTITVLAGAAVLFLAIAAAWPLPAALLAVCLINFFVLSWTAFHRRLFPVHIAALFCLTLGWLTLLHLEKSALADSLAGCRQLFGSMQSGMLLAGLGAALVFSSEVLLRLRQRIHANYYAAAAAVTGIACVSIAWNHGLQQPISAAFLCTIVGIAILVANVRWRGAWFSCAGLAALSGGVLWALHGWLPGEYALWSMAIAGYGLILAVTGVLLTRRSSSNSHASAESEIKQPTASLVFGKPILYCAEIAAAAAILVALGSRWFDVWQLEHIAAGTILTIVYFLLTLRQHRLTTAALMALVFISTTAAATAWSGRIFAARDVQTIVALAIALSSLFLAVFSFAVQMRRTHTRRFSPWFRIVPAAWREVILVAGLLAIWLAISAPSFSQVGLHALTLAAGCAVAFLQAGQNRSVLLSWIGSVLLLATIGTTIHWYSRPEPHVLILQSSLLHATIMTMASLLIHRASRRAASTALRVFAKPFGFSGLIATLFTLPVFPALHGLGIVSGQLGTMAGYAFWLAALWLVISWAGKRRWLFAGCQIVTAGAVMYAVAVWLQGQPWILAEPMRGWLEPRSLQAFGFGLALFCLLWVVARIVLQRNKTASVILRPNWPGVDRFVLGGLVLGNLGLVDWAIIRDVAAELIPGDAGLSFSWWPVVYSQAYGAGGWLVTAMLVIVLLTSLWQPAPHIRQTAAILGLALSALTVASLLAGFFAPQRSAASALRWMLAGSFLFCSILVWGRRYVATVTAALRMPVYANRDLAKAVRVIFLDGMVLPVLLLTGSIAVLLLTGWNIPGPIEGSAFAQFSPFVSFFGPLALITMVLVGYALRERSPGYAFSAGLLATIASSGGYALALKLAGETFQHEHYVMMLQIAAAVLAGYGICWLTVRRRVQSWYENGPSPLAQPLLIIQTALPIGLNVILLSIGILWLTPLTPWRALTPANIWYAAAPPWTVAAGDWVGWLAFLLTALVVFQYRHARVSPIVAGCFAIGLAAISTCTVEGLLPGRGFRWFLTAIAAATVLWAVLPWWGKQIRPEKSIATKYFNAAPLWVHLFAAVLLPFSLQMIFVHHDRVWGPVLIAAVGAAAVLVALQRRGEVSLFVGSLYVSLAAVLLQWHYFAGVPFANWWVYCLGAVAVVLLSAVLVFWLGSRPRVDFRASKNNGLLPLLQLSLGVFCTTLPFLLIFMMLAVNPRMPLANVLIKMGGPLGWLAVLTTILALGWFVADVRFRDLVHVLGFGGILVVGQLVATASYFWSDLWLSWHILPFGLAVVAMVLCAGGWAGSRGARSGLPNPAPSTPNASERPGGFAKPQAERSISAGSESCRHIGLPVRPTRLWVECIGIMLAGMALRAALIDPLQPWHGVTLILSAAGLATALFFWQRRLGYVHIAAGLLASTGLLLWISWGDGQTNSLLAIAAMTCGLAVSLSALMESWLNRRQRTDDANNGPYPIEVLAVVGQPIFVFGFIMLSLAGNGDGRGLGILLEFLTWCALPTAVMLTVMLVVHSAPSQLQRDAVDSTWQLNYPFSAPAIVFGIALFGTLVLLAIAWQIAGRAFLPSSGLAWGAWAALAVAALLLLPKRRLSASASAAAPLYAVGFLGVFLALHHSSMSIERLIQFGIVAVAGFTLLAGILGWFFSVIGPVRTQLARFAPDLREQTWFPATQFIVAICVVGVSFFAVLYFDNPLNRLFGTAALLLLLPAGWLLERTVSAWSVSNICTAPRLRYAVLILGGLAVLSSVWALPSAARASYALELHALLLAVLGVLTVFYALGLPRLLSPENNWSMAAWKLSRIFWLAAGAVVLSVLAHEAVLLWLILDTALATWSIVLVAAALAGLIGSSVWFAMAPRHDPLALPDFWRAGYVYAAEILLALLCVHLRLTVPDIFGLMPAKYVAIVILLVAFAGIGLSELFRRMDLDVLADPLHRTGMFLPLLPLIGFWFAPGEIAKADFTIYSVYWFLAGGIYIVVALTRRSTVLAMIAALAVNFGFWSLLFHNRNLGLGFASHPQLWLIPLSLILLAAEHLNREKLPAASAAALRYFGLLVLYVSSTADLIIAGLGDVGMSLALAVLAVAGVLAGILLRVQAFLFAGVTFLLLVIGARICHAAVQPGYTWVWWAAVIALGIAVLTLFAIFEKHRLEMLRMIEEFKRWK